MLCFFALYRTAKAKKNGKTADGFSFKKIFPWFILYFIAASVITTVVTSLSTNAFSAAYSSYFIPAMKKLAKFFIAMAMGSVADLCVIPMQDYLCLDERARINTPSTLGGNWVWRMDKDALTDELVEQMKQMTVLYGR